MVIALQVGLQNPGIHRPRLREWDLARGCEPGPNLTSDILGYVSFEREHVAHISFVTARPYMLVRGNIDELRGDTHAIAATLHCSLDDAIHIELVRDFWQ